MVPFGWAKVVAWNKQSCYQHVFFLSATSVTELNERCEVYVCPSRTPGFENSPKPFGPLELQ